MPPPENEPKPVDFRQYIGIIFFRWQIIAVCFLYALLGGVLYIQFAPKKYRTEAKITVYRDPLLTLAQQGGQWMSFDLHRYMLTNPRLIERVVEKLVEEWGEKFRTKLAMQLPVQVNRRRGVHGLLTISVESRYPDYSQAFLEALIEEHRGEWDGLQRQARDSASVLLSAELERLEHEIKEAEDDLLEYQRLHDIARVAARSTMESRYLEALMQRRNELSTELMLLEAQFPQLDDAGPTVIGDVDRLTRETGAVKAAADTPLEGERGTGTESEGPLPSVPGGDRTADSQLTEEMRGWQDLRVRFARLEQQERALTRDLRPEHPQVQAVRKEIMKVKSDLEIAAQVALGRLQDRHRALQIQLDAIESAEYKWQAKNMLAAQRKAEHKRIAAVIGRFEKNYAMLYNRLHDMRVSEELKAEQFRVTEPPTTEDNPVWPDPAKILLMVLGLGLGAGFGLALLVQTLDNKVQSVKDVEDVLGIPFLGGVPYWVHSGLEHTIRPIVTEEHSAGAVEAYRALRTSILAAMEKLNEKTLIVTSADSREGKTLTSLNLAIMVAQMGRRVLLVDMDLRRGRLHRSLGVERTPGATDALKSGGSLRSYISGTRIDNLDLIPTGSSIDDAAELLQSSSVAEMFAEIQDDYDFVIMDSSPVLRVTDTVILATQGVGVALYIARVNHTPKPLIQYSLNMLKDARVVGLVMNSIEMHKISSLYYTYQYPNYAYYSNAYAYGYNYYYYGDESRKHGSRRRPRSNWQNRRRQVTEWLRRTFLPMD